jgi:hypothetical protein
MVDAVVVKENVHYTVLSEDFGDELAAGVTIESGKLTTN